MFKITIWNTKQLLEDEIIKRMDEANKYLLEKIKEETPEDTFKLQNSHTIEPTRKEWSKIIWTISNDTEYAVYVEYWLGKKYNYYKNWWRRKWGSPFKTGDWARMFSKSYDSQENIDKIQNIFNK